MNDTAKNLVENLKLSFRASLSGTYEQGLVDGYKAKCNTEAEALRCCAEMTPSLFAGSEEPYSPERVSYMVRKTFLGFAENNKLIAESLK